MFGHIMVDHFSKQANLVILKEGKIESISLDRVCRDEVERSRMKHSKLQDNVNVSSYDCEAFNALSANEIDFLGKVERGANLVERCVFDIANALHDKRFVMLIDRTILKGLNTKLLLQQRNATAGIQTGQEAALQGSVDTDWNLSVRIRRIVQNEAGWRLGLRVDKLVGGRDERWAKFGKQGKLRI
ncbi:hypothetical protein BJ508DRAFT_308982 [Ascobolus immersus RN42]|uniref:Uncharacterized protein n=1 Tax=Ascobolus immersus RN42 TaxID=1160509 RepID=A0A3N4I046_ASCIM|nr:hypothetical protein BJ508DRAFT_308982 [Ascobolus immersus RN42]